MTAREAIYKTALEHIRNGSDAVCTDCGWMGGCEEAIFQEMCEVPSFFCPKCRSQNLQHGATVFWKSTIQCFASIEADSPEEAIEEAKAGRYDSVDSEPGKDIANSYRAKEGENGFAPVLRKRP